METYRVRTDLAAEASEIASRRGEVAGVKTQRSRVAGVDLTDVRIESAAAARTLGKPCGRYLTFDVGRVWQDSTETQRDKTLFLAETLRPLVPEGEGAVLIAGLGNRHITADAVGPCVSEHLLVTRHMRDKRPDLYESLGLSPVAAITPGVLGETGMESADIIESVAARLRPRAVILVDALASRRLSRLATTVQVSDAGLSPGSGVGNRRSELSRDTLGVPVLSVGVPTVVDAATLAYDAVETLGYDNAPSFESLHEVLTANGLNFFVTPKETDEILHKLSILIAHALNLALQEKLSYEEMVALAS